jgi:hypothetical protein
VRIFFGAFRLYCKFFWVLGQIIIFHMLNNCKQRGILNILSFFHCLKIISTPVQVIRHHYHNYWPRECFTGLQFSNRPSDHQSYCKKPHEIFACGYSEPSCGNTTFCGLPPCQWKCWCDEPYFRSSSGHCVQSCPKVNDTMVVSLNFFYETNRTARSWNEWVDRKNAKINNKKFHKEWLRYINVTDVWGNFVPPVYRPRKPMMLDGIENFK